MNAPTTIEEFDALHNGNTSIIAEDNRVYYEDGAYRENQKVLCGARMSPPTDQFELMQRLVIYHETWLKRELAAFDQFQTRLIQSIESPHFGGDEKPVVELERLQQVVINRQKQLKQVQRKLEKASPDYIPPAERKRRAEEEARYQARRDALLKRVKDIRV